MRSVKSPVTRLREYSYTIDHSSFCDAVIQEFARENNHSITPTVITQEYLAEPRIKQHYEHLRSWDWTFGSGSPEFTHQLSNFFTEFIAKIVPSTI